MVSIQDVNERLVRMEARLCQLMLHMGLVPQERKYPKDETPQEKPVDR